MKLPKIDVPFYNITLPLSKKELKFRPFLVKENKLLLMAKEADDTKVMFESIKQIVNNCVLTENIIVDDIPIIDLHYLFINLRARSVSEVVDMEYICNNVVEKDGVMRKCLHVVPLQINLLDIQIDIPKDFTYKVEFTETLGVMLKSPDLETSIKIENFNGSDIEKTLMSIAQCIDYIYDADNVYHSKDITEAEITEWVESLPTEYLNKFNTFFEVYPKLQKDIKFKCPKCGWEETIRLEGLRDFLD